MPPPSPVTTETARGQVQLGFDLSGAGIDVLGQFRLRFQLGKGAQKGLLQPQQRGIVSLQFFALLDPLQGNAEGLDQRGAAARHYVKI